MADWFLDRVHSSTYFRAVSRHGEVGVERDGSELSVVDGAAPRILGR